MAGDSIGFRQNGRIILSSVEPNTAGPAAPAPASGSAGSAATAPRNVARSYGAAGHRQNNNSLQEVGPAGNQIAPRRAPPS